ncbi:PIN domain-containing protein [Pleurocapsales cyanobacterium LEGE 06147]|nr:PIN domain-containing protein [Pleurocapsales cyanobacterium LEGE 06147]
MKVLLDTNIILDLAFKREPFYDGSDLIFSSIEQGQVKGYVSASTFSDLYYIIRKERGKDWTIGFLTRLTSICQVATVNLSIIAMALTANFRDFEDAIQYSTAIVHKLDVIVTRNPKDFPVVTPRIMSPDSLIQELTHSQ